METTESNIERKRRKRGAQEVQEGIPAVIGGDEGVGPSIEGPGDSYSASIFVDDQNYEPVPITVKSLLEAGAHYGHQTQRWNPKMVPYIFSERNGIHIINLDLTLKLWERAKKFVLNLTGGGGSILIVGTKNQVREIVESAAKRCGAFYVTSRWLGGTLSNFETIKKSISRMTKLEDLLKKAEDEQSDVRLSKKEKLGIKRQLDKLEANIGGIRAMRNLPSAVFVIDINREAIAVSEARKLHIPVIAIVDTNVDPELVDYPIPSNDDATRAVKLIIDALADAAIEGRKVYEEKMERDTPVGGGRSAISEGQKNTGQGDNGSVSQEASAG